MFYFFRSAFSRGLFNTLRLMRAELVYEKKFGIQTSRIKESASKEFFHYQGASYLVLLRVLQELYAHTGDIAFTDIGCGKGRAMFVAEHCGYSRLCGIELDQELLTDAKSNQLRYVPRRSDAGFTFLHANALEVDYPDRPTIYFLFNPFHETVLRGVLQKIRASTSSETWFVYMNPLFPEPFRELASEPVKEFKTLRYREAMVYRWREGQIPGC